MHTPFASNKLGAAVLGAGARWGIGSLAAAAELAVSGLNAVVYWRVFVQGRS